MLSDMGIEQVDRLIDVTFPTLEGWCSEQKAKRMARLVADTPSSRPPLCVELGVFGGRGVIAMGLAVKHVLAGQGRVDGIDPYTAAASLEGTNDAANQAWWSQVDYQKIYSSAMKGILDLGLGEIVHLIVRRSQDMVGDYAKQSIDVLHQDSNHSEEVSCYEVATWTPRVRPGGYWVFDDINWPSTKKAQASLAAHGYTLLETHDTWAVYRAP